MALQFVGGLTANKAGATSGNTTISLTGLTGGISSTAAANDIVVAVFATGSTADRTLAITDGTTNYTLIDSERYANGTVDSNLRVAYKIMGSTPDTTTTFGPTGNAQDGGAMAVHVWRGVDLNTPQDVTATGATGTGTGRPDGASIQPTTAGSIILVAGGGAAGTGATFTASELSNFRTDNGVDTNDGFVGIGSFAWTSGAFNPAQWTGGTTGAGDSWTSVSLALRPAVLQTLTPSLFTNSQTFPAATVNQTITAGLFTNTQTFFAPTVGQVQGLVAPLHTNDNTFFAPTVAPGAVSLTPDLLTNDQAFFSPSIAAVLTAGLFTNDQTFFSPTVAPGAVALTPSLFTNNQSFLALTVSVGAVELTPSLFANTQDFPSATISTGAVTLTPNLFTNSQEFFAPSVGQEGGTQHLTAPLLTNTQSFPVSVVSATYGIAAPLVTNAQSFFAPTASAANTLAPPLVANDNTFFSPVVSTGGDQTIIVPLVANDNVFYPATVGRVVETPAARTSIAERPARDFIVSGIANSSAPLLPRTTFAPKRTA